MPRAAVTGGITNVHVTPTFSNVPAAQTLRVSVLESINGGAPKPFFLGEELSRSSSDASSVEGPTIRLVLLPAEAKQRFVLQIADGVSHAVLGRVALSHAQLLQQQSAGTSLRMGAPDSSVEDEAVPANEEKEEAEGVFSVVLDLEAGVGTSLTKKGSAKHVSHHVDVSWGEWPQFDHAAARAELVAAASNPASAADFVEVEVAASGIVGGSAVAKSSTLVSAHLSGGEATLLDHTEVVKENHAPSFRQTLLVQVAHNGRALPSGDIVLRVYDASDKGDIEGLESLLAQTAPLSLSALAQVRSSGESLHLPLRLESNAAVDKKLQKKKAEVIIVSVRQFGEKRPRFARQHALAGPSSSPKASSSAQGPAAGLAVDVPPVSLPRAVTRPTPVGSATPFEAAAATPIALDQLVIVDAAGKEHAVPPAPGAVASSSAFAASPKGAKTPSTKSPKGSESLSLSVGARNIPKLRAMASASSPLVVLWEKKPEDKNADYTLLASTEAVVAQPDPNFVQPLTFLLPPIKTGLFSSTPKGSASALAEQFRLDVFDVSERRIEVSTARVGFAFLSRAELSSLGHAEDYAEQNVPLQSEKKMLDKKLKQRQASVQLARAGAPEAKVAERQAARSSAVEAKRTAVAQKKAAWIESRNAQQAAAALPIGAQAADAVVGAVEAIAGGVAAVIAGVVATVQGKSAEEVAAETKEAEEAAAAAAAAAATPKAEEKKSEPALASGSGLPPLAGRHAAGAAPAHSRRGSFSVAEKGAGSRRGSGDHSKEHDDALLAEKVALARLEAAQKARDAHNNAVKSHKSDVEREKLDADLATAKTEATAATARAASAKEALAAKRRTRAEAEHAEAEAKAAAAAAPGLTPWGARVKPVTSATGSGRNSRRQSLSLAEDVPSAGGRAEISSLIQARRMAALSAQSAAQVALLPARPAGAASQIFAFAAAVKNVKNSGAWNPCLAVYELASPAPAAADAAAAAAAHHERWVYLDHTEKVEKVGESGVGEFKKQLLVEYFPASAAPAADADAAAAPVEDAPAQVLRFSIFNTGSKDEAGASDLIASGQVSLRDLASAFGDASGSVGSNNKTVEVFLYSAGNKALSDRLKRQKACVVLTLTQSADGATGASAGTSRGLVVGAAPVPLTLEGGADPDPAKEPFAVVESAVPAAAKAAPAAAAEAEAAPVEPEEIGAGSLVMSESVQAAAPADEDEPEAAADAAAAAPEAAAAEAEKPAEVEAEAPKAAEEAPVAAAEEAAPAAAGAEVAAAAEKPAAAAADAAPAADEDDSAAAASSSDAAVGPGQKQCDGCKEVKSKKADFSAAQGKKPNGKCKSCLA